MTMDTIIGTADDDTLQATFGSGGSYLQGLAGSDTLNGSGGTDFLSGGEGTDFLSGGEGNDTYEGGSGDDYFSDWILGSVGKGGFASFSGGADTYRFAAGFGHDQIVEFGSTDPASADVDVVEFGEGIRFEDLIFSQIDNQQSAQGPNAAGGYALLIRSRVSTDTLTINFAFDGNGTRGTGVIEKFKFADGTEKTWDQLVAGVPVARYWPGSDGVIRGVVGADTLSGSYGNDQLVAANGGGGQLIGGHGDDTMTGGQGIDTFVIDAKNEEQGHDLIHADSQDILRLDRLNRGDLKFTGSSAGTIVVGNWLNTDTVSLDKAGTWDGLTVQFADGSHMSGAELVAAAKAPATGVIKTGTTGAETLTGGTGNDTLIALEGNDRLTGAEGNDYLSGGDGNDTLTGGAGNDTLIGGKGNDIYALNKGAGKDVLYAQPFIFGDENENGGTVLFNGVASTDITSIRHLGNNLVIQYGTSDQLTIQDYYAESSLLETLKFSDMTWVYEFHNIPANADRAFMGTDAANTFTGGAGNEYFFSAGGNDQLSGGQGNDTLYAGEGDDTLTGGAGNDLLDGGNGADVYVLGKGAGTDIVTVGLSGNKTVKFTDVASTDVSAIDRAGIDLVLQYGNGDQLTIKEYFNETPGAPLTKLAFTDTNWALADVAVMVDYRGTNAGEDMRGGQNIRNRIYGMGGNDNLTGGTLADLLDGGAGHDVLNAGDGDDTLIGGSGNDTLYGGFGNDTYILSKGAGVDTITELPDMPASTDVVRFTDVATTDVTSIQRQGSDLVLNYGASDQLTIGNYFVGTATAKESIDALRFTDATWNQTDVRNKAVYTGAGWAENMVGYDDASNSIHGLGGNDTIVGGNQADVLEGGWGNDILTGGLGADTFVFSKGDGQDIVHADASDTLSLWANIPRGDLVLGKVGAVEPDTLVLAIKDSTDTITLDHVSQLGGLKIKFGSDGSSRTLAALLAEQQQPEPPAPLTLTGTAGNDLLRGKDGKDTLTGGKGDDLLIGGKGGDTYVFNRGDGRDLIVDTDANLLDPDLLKIGAAKSNQLWLTRSGDNLAISIIGTKDSVTVQNWFKGPANQIEKITALGDGKSLTAAKVDALVSAMAGFTPSAMGGANLPPTTPPTLTSLIASSWS